MQIPNCSFFVQKTICPHYDVEIFILEVDDAQEYQYWASDLTPEDYRLLDEYATAHQQYFNH
ncbi:hypothetical protein [Gloeothece verrucosa]|uniref:Uncharacterized protein n=1 Tax=Gloeothece verrucosa (strain PCC 7822) TaxID=497965 RepID=E0UN33_GLOV7|nr:hypothetical protein [Gloeothece verrucosa]ADN18363.1 hypothetical protein Cyan7822_6611 [Gloeothece verrucosa PCC 7822]